jgi:hypothetical protein
MSSYLTKKDQKRIKKWMKTIVNDRIKKISGKKAIAKIKLPYEVMGIGHYRIVYDLGDGNVLKVPRLLKGIECNEKEISLYHRCPSDVRVHFAKVIDYGEGWLVMKKLKSKVPSKKSTYKEELRAAIKVLAKDGIKVFDVFNGRSLKDNNVRFDKNLKKAVVIDYAKVKLSKKT